jgi:hypothetical protein
LRLPVLRQELRRVPDALERFRIAGGPVLRIEHVQRRIPLARLLVDDRRVEPPQEGDPVSGGRIGQDQPDRLRKHVVLVAIPLLPLVRVLGQVLIRREQGAACAVPHQHHLLVSPIEHELHRRREVERQLFPDREGEIGVVPCHDREAGVTSIGERRL